MTQEHPPWRLRRCAAILAASLLGSGEEDAGEAMEEDNVGTGTEGMLGALASFIQKLQRGMQVGPHQQGMLDKRTCSYVDKELCSSMLLYCLSLFCIQQKGLGRVQTQ